jgi:hypothetical protein
VAYLFEKIGTKVTEDGKLIPRPDTKRSLGTIDLGDLVDGSDGEDFVNLLDEAGLEKSINMTEILDKLMARAVGMEARSLDPVGTGAEMPHREVEVGA